MTALTSTMVGRAFVLHELAADEVEFEAILDESGIEDSDNFTSEEMADLRRTANQLRSQSRSQPRSYVAPLLTSSPNTVPSGSTTPCGVSGFVDVYIQHLEEEKNRVEAGMTAALSSYEQWLTDRSLQFFQQANEMRSSVFIQAAQNPLQGYTPRTIAALADNVGIEDSE